MVKLLGLVLIASSIISLFAGAAIGLRFSSPSQISGNVITNIITQPKVDMGVFDYIEAIVFSYSIISMIMGIMFLVRYNTKSI